MPTYICPQCESELSHGHMSGPYYYPDGEDIYCSVCHHTAHETEFKIATFNYRNQEKQESLREEIAEENLSLRTREYLDFAGQEIGSMDGEET